MTYFICQGFKEKFKMTKLTYFKRLHDLVEDARPPNDVSLTQDPRLFLAVSNIPISLSFLSQCHPLLTSIVL